MADRLYNVSVTQTMEMIHIVRAPNKREARRIIQDLTYDRIEDDDPRLVESYPSFHVGTEKVNALVYRVDEDPDRENGSAER